ncbi:efflux RND transporter periplasmic adaptor subunit [candidate division KSB1 bacterium]|nr:efflux RND transporter periplasmic adaptor subunit [candidate division KSB1 bacterium]MBL7092599.1 efflux RND transporter periplasmic adaptor subunit [candidate division KSB1 bacterium]
MTKKKIFIIIGVVIIIAVFVIVNMKKGRGGEISVQVEKVKRGDITQVVSASGKIQPETDVKISANVSAEIIGLYVKEGEMVEKGQLLIELDRTKYQAAVQRAKSTKKAAEASLKKAENDFQRAKDLYNQKLSSTADLENAEANLKLAESQLEQAIASLDQANDDLVKTKLFSPFNGTVTIINKEIGEIALGSMFQADVILEVADLSRMEVLAEIDENDIPLVEIGDTTDIEIDAIPDTTFIGIVSEMALAGNTRGRGTQEEITNFKVKIAIVDEVEKLRPGMSSTVDIRTEIRRNILQIPIQSVTVRAPKDIPSDEEEQEAKDDSVQVKQDESETKSTDKDEMIEVVFIVEEGTAKIIPVETGISSDTDIEVKSGLEVDQQVVIGSYRVLTKTLKDGSPIKISKKDKSKSEE